MSSLPRVAHPNTSVLGDAKAPPPPEVEARMRAACNEARYALEDARYRLKDLEGRARQANGVTP